jgi:UDP-glucuronate decarboxylase
MSQTILVTGGFGFLGSHLCQFLIDQGHRVTAVDNELTGSISTLQHLINHPNFTPIKHNIVTPFEGEFSQIYNLACPASPVQYQTNPIETIKTSFVGMMNMLELAKETGARILQASTSEIYGDPQIHPQPETYWGNVNTIGPRSCYDEGKRVGESLCMAYHRHENIDVRIARIFNTYGPNMAVSDGRVISNFIVQALKGKPITVYGDGYQTRSFCYVDDLIRGLVSLMNAPVSGPINLGNPTEICMLDLAKKIIHLTASSSVIDFNPLPADDPKARRPDITQAKTVLNWEPSTSLRQGLEKTISYFKNKV